MFIPAEALADWLAKDILSKFCDHFPDAKDEYNEILQSSVHMSIGLLAKCSASYHDADHTAMVTQAAQDILIGKSICGEVSQEDWVHLILAALFHDIGFCRNICRADKEEEFVANDLGGLFRPAAGKSDAVFAPYHVDRGMIFVRERFACDALVDEDRLAQAIACTRFPPKDHSVDLHSEPALLRAADLIGQIADPLYSRKLTNLFYEMSELGTAAAQGYKTPGDMVTVFPKFYRGIVAHLLGPAMKYLNETGAGQEWVQRLDVLLQEADAGYMTGGPFPVLNQEALLFEK
ncbi:metal-dependent phosphohydrolase [Donghicola sp. C2-DW-16]|uniref:Metal-dependent phosphohydrolase n=1 Tax=Donghicola mangrovi TaxID=2729614 RepID=A0ABX2PJM4_9RHOB|nr:metal-dependent phosphohydrolase [Donghicola mangrovi]NVO29294.1 metal-dependent phosphohydrolase [Donghicola mangrovi]